MPFVTMSMHFGQRRERPSSSIKARGGGGLEASALALGLLGIRPELPDEATRPERPHQDAGALGRPSS